MSKYVGGNTIQGIKYPNFEEYVEEYEKCVEKGDKNSNIDFVAYGGKVWKFLNDMQTIPAKTLEKIPGHYDKFLKNVKAIFKKRGGIEPNEESVLCFMDNKFIPELDAAFDEYIKEGKNDERKSWIKEFREKSFKPFTRRISENVLCSNENIKEQAETEGKRTIDNPLYKKVYLGGKVWEKTKPESGISIFQNNKFMKTLTLGKGVKTVSTGTFENCESLEHIYIQAEELTIEKESFKDCEKLNKVEVSSSVKKLTIEEGAFSNCPNLSNINLNSSSITFQNNKFMKTLTLGKGVETVNTGTFWNCKKLEHIYIEAEALTIEKEAFKNCLKLNKVKVSSSVKTLTIKKGAFTGCDKFENMDLSSFSGELEAEDGAFSNCGKLRRKSISGDEKSKAVLAIRAVLPE